MGSSQNPKYQVVWWWIFKTSVADKGFLSTNFRIFSASSGFILRRAPDLGRSGRDWNLSENQFFHVVSTVGLLNLFVFATFTQLITWAIIKSVEAHYLILQLEWNCTMFFSLKLLEFRKNEWYEFHDENYMIKFYTNDKELVCFYLTCWCSYNRWQISNKV